MENNLAAVCVGRFVSQRLRVVYGVGTTLEPWLVGGRYYILGDGGSYWILGKFSVHFVVDGTEVEWSIVPAKLVALSDVTSSVWDLADPGFDPLEIVTWVAGVRGLVSSLESGRV